MLEIKRHEWKENGENHASPFFVWVDGQPRFDLSDCNKCRHYRGDDPCAMAVKVGDKGDDKLYPFCGRVCGYFDMPNVSMTTPHVIPETDLAETLVGGTERWQEAQAWVQSGKLPDGLDPATKADWEAAAAQSPEIGRLMGKLPEEKPTAASGPERLVEGAWGIIANAHGGNWDLATEEWRSAVVRWRDEYHEWITQRRPAPNSPGTPDSSTEPTIREQFGNMSDSTKWTPRSEPTPDSSKARAVPACIDCTYVRQEPWSACRLCERPCPAERADKSEAACGPTGKLFKAKIVASPEKPGIPVSRREALDISRETLRRAEEERVAPPEPGFDAWFTRAYGNQPSEASLDAHRTWERQHDAAQDAWLVATRLAQPSPEKPAGVPPPSTDWHGDDCSIYKPLSSGLPDAGICTCGFGLRRVRIGEMNQLMTEERANQKPPVPPSDSLIAQVLGIPCVCRSTSGCSKRGLDRPLGLQDIRFDGDYWTIRCSQCDTVLREVTMIPVASDPTPSSERPAGPPSDAEIAHGTGGLIERMEAAHEATAQSALHFGPPKPAPIVPPEGYRLLQDGEHRILGDMYRDLLDGAWKRIGMDAGRPYVPALGHAPVARKIEPAPEKPRDTRQCSSCGHFHTCAYTWFKADKSGKCELFEPEPSPEKPAGPPSEAKPAPGFVVWLDAHYPNVTHLGYDFASATWRAATHAAKYGPPTDAAIAQVLSLGVKCRNCTTVTPWGDTASHDEDAPGVWVLYCKRCATEIGRVKP